jgi:hypothetical protein
MGTTENPLSTSKLSTSDDRISIKIPKKAKIYEYLNVDNRQDDRPVWERLDALYAQAEHNKEEFAVTLYDDFVQRITIFFPDKLDQLNKLRPLIIKHLLKGDPLDDSYYEMIREL